MFGWMWFQTQWQWLLTISVLLLIAEMTTGTFYLLVLSLACAIASAISYYFNTSFMVDLLIVSALSCAGYLFLYFHNRKNAHAVPDPRNDLNSNIGCGAIIRKILPDGGYELEFRGTTWNGVPNKQAINADTPMAEGDPCRIVGQKANTLIVEPLTPVKAKPADSSTHSSQPTQP